MDTLYTVASTTGELLAHMKAALLTATYGLGDDDSSWDRQYVMFYQGHGDVKSRKMSVFSYDASFVCATHSRVSLDNRGVQNNHLPVDDFAGDMRAYISAYDLSRLVKWLKPLPKGFVHFNWLFHDVGQTDFQVSFVPDRSSKDVQPLNMEYQILSSWIDTFRVPFNQGRSAYRNADKGVALRQFSAFTVRPLVLRWLDEVFGGRSVSFIPFDKGNMVYIRSDFCASIECTTCLPYTALNNSTRLPSSEG